MLSCRGLRKQFGTRLAVDGAPGGSMEARAALGGIEVHKPDLEGVFLALTGKEWRD